MPQQPHWTPEFLAAQAWALLVTGQYERASQVLLEISTGEGRAEALEDYGNGSLWARTSPNTKLDDAIRWTRDLIEITKANAIPAEMRWTIVNDRIISGGTVLEGAGHHMTEITGCVSLGTYEEELAVLLPRLEQIERQLVKEKAILLRTVRRQMVLSQIAG